MNYNYYTGPNIMKIKQQLVAKMKEEIKAEIKQEIRELKENQTAGCSGGSKLASDVKKQLFEIKEEITALKGNRTGCVEGKGLCQYITLHQVKPACIYV